MSNKVKKVSVFPKEVKKASTRSKSKKAADKINNNPKLRQFKAQEVAEKEGKAARSDGSIMRKAEVSGSDSDGIGKVRAKYGVNKKEGAYHHGWQSEKLKGAVAKKKPKSKSKPKTDKTPTRGKKK